MSNDIPNIEDEEFNLLQQRIESENKTCKSRTLEQLLDDYISTEDQTACAIIKERILDVERERDELKKSINEHHYRKFSSTKLSKVFYDINQE